MFEGAATPTWTPNWAQEGFLGFKMGPKRAGHIGPSGCFALAKRTCLKPLRPQLGPPTGPQEGLKRGLLGPSWGHLGATFGHPGGILVLLGPAWRQLEPSGEQSAGAY